MNISTTDGQHPIHIWSNVLGKMLTRAVCECGNKMIPKCNVLKQKSLQIKLCSNKV